MRKQKTAWWRRAAVNKGLLITLIVLGVASGGYWIVYRGIMKESVKDAVKPTGQEVMIGFSCSACNVFSELPESEANALTANEQGFVKCPKCGKIAATRNNPRKDMFITQP